MSYSQVTDLVRHPMPQKDKIGSLSLVCHLDIERLSNWLKKSETGTELHPNE
jgi:hypothetical protein